MGPCVFAFVRPSVTLCLENRASDFDDIRFLLNLARTVALNHLLAVLCLGKFFFFAVFFGHSWVKNTLHVVTLYVSGCFLPFSSKPLMFFCYLFFKLYNAMV